MNVFNAGSIKTGLPGFLWLNSASLNHFSKKLELIHSLSLNHHKVMQYEQPHPSASGQERSLGARCNRIGLSQSGKLNQTLQCVESPISLACSVFHIRRLQRRARFFRFTTGFACGYLHQYPSDTFIIKCKMNEAVKSYCQFLFNI